MSTAGPRAGKAIADIIAHVLRTHENAAAPIRDEVIRRRLESTLEDAESVLAPILAPFVQELIDHPDTPDEHRELLRSLTEPEHQWQVLLILFALGFVIKPLVEAATTPLLQGIRNLAWKTHPNMPFTPADAALAVLKGAMPHDAGVSEAENNGMKPELFDVLTEITGEPLSLQELLYLKRRGFIDEARFERGVRQSRIRDEWIDVARDLEYVPPAAGDVVMFALKGHMSEADAKAIYAADGVDPRYFDTHLLSVGRPPGIEQELSLLNRGEVDVAHVEQAIRMSDINNTYIADVLKLRVYIPPPRTIPTLVKNGVISDELALQLFKDNGLTDSLAAAYLKSAKTEKHQPHKNVAEGQIVRAYGERSLDAGAAKTMLKALGYDDAGVTFLLHLADSEREWKMKQQGVATIRSRYITHRLDRSVVSRDLATLGVVPAEAADLLKVWDLERAATTRELTPEQVLMLFQRGKLNETDTLNRLESLGYSTADAHLLMVLVETSPAKKPQGARPLTEAQVLRLYKVGEITFDDAESRLRAMGLSQNDVTLLLQENAPPTTGG